MKYKDETLGNDKLHGSFVYPTDPRWGNISGNIEDQEDLVKYIDSKNSKTEDRLNVKIYELNNTTNNLSKKLTSEIDRAKKAEEQLELNLLAKINSSKEDIQAIRSKTDNEILRATQAEAKITENLNNEIETRTSEVARLDERIDNETTRAKEAEQILTDDLNSEILRAKEAEALEQEIRISEIWRVDTRIDNEINRATEAEQAIADKLDAEIDRSIKKDNDLQRQLVTINSASDVIDIVKTKQELLNYNQHITTNDIIKVMVDESFYGAITYYRYIQETTLNTLLAINHVNCLPFVFQGATYTWMRIASEGPYYTQEQIDAFLKEERDARIDADTALNNKINNEINRAKNAEKVLTDNLNSEITRAKDVEKVLTDDLNSEIKRAKDAEKILTDGLASEVKRAKDAEKVLTDDLNSEISRAKNAEKALTDNLDSEITRAEDAESVLQTNIDAEEQARIDTDTILANSLNAEIHRASKTEEALDKKIDTENERAVKAELKETEERTASDEYLQSQIDSITASSDVVDIVGTKQELINYDKPLNVSDIIKVLKDETLDNATTYYRYVEEATLARLVGDNFNSLPFALQGKSYTWVLIGSQGPYYTIAEVDALLDEIRDTAREENKRATDAEKVLTDNLNSEINRAKDTEKVLTDNLDSEISRATVADKVLTDNLNAEIKRAKESEKTLDNKIEANTDLIHTKQDILVPGKNIKTINGGQNILGEGDMFVEAVTISWGRLIGSLDDQADLKDVLDALKARAISVNDETVEVNW